MTHWSHGPNAEAIREKIRQKAIGRTMSPESRLKSVETRKARGNTNAGDKHWNWKGGKAWRRFRDPRYQEWRNDVLERDNYTCQGCGKQCKKYERGLAAHHIKSYAHFPKLRFELSNGKTLCRLCHMKIHGKAPRAKAPIPCFCGCGTMISPVDAYGRKRKYVNHHASRGKQKPESMKKTLSDQRKGKSLTMEHREKIAAGLRNSGKRIGRPPKH